MTVRPRPVPNYLDCALCPKQFVGNRRLNDYLDHLRDYHGNKELAVEVREYYAGRSDVVPLIQRGRTRTAADQAARPPSPDPSSPDPAAEPVITCGVDGCEREFEGPNRYQARGGHRAKAHPKPSIAAQRLAERGAVEPPPTPKGTKEMELERGIQIASPGGDQSRVETVTVPDPDDPPGNDSYLAGVEGALVAVDEAGFGPPIPWPEIRPAADQDVRPDVGVVIDPTEAVLVVDALGRERLDLIGPLLSDVDDVTLRQTADKILLYLRLKNQGYDR